MRSGCLSGIRNSCLESRWGAWHLMRRPHEFFDHAPTARSPGGAVSISFFTPNLSLCLIVAAVNASLEYPHILVLFERVYY